MPRRFALVGIFAIGGCGRIGFGAIDDAAAPIDAAMIVDGPPDAAPCVWSAFSAPAKLPAVLQSPADDWFASVTPDGLEVCLHSFRPPSKDAAVWCSTRATPADAWGMPSLIASLDTANFEGQPTLTADHLDLVFVRQQAGTYTAYETVRATPGGAFGAASPVANLGGDSFSPWLSADGLRLVYSSTANGSFQLFETTRPARTMPFGTRTELASVDDMTALDASATLSADGLELFFASNRPGGKGGHDVYTSHRTALGQPFASPTFVPEVSSNLDDIGLRLSNDGTTLYLEYDTDANGGTNADLWSATRTCQ